ncbi:hypothetical protein BO78DRAFT_199268 [Aspergillus sclerotiicarbonarius CBS 121057]|uniref:Uncharacterized protein n=1 Tax=Aspergillus sclerotiicarbonarius (strain CBS 121057 / IBT 28362) TaxID=1448318 RepID=A0A319E510_ASPSB|nr:hypothetical protein BO78DRAFT_199268 [Aspergillus sclerotiicarbonarius CBS 121057]
MRSPPPYCRRRPPGSCLSPSRGVRRSVCSVFQCCLLPHGACFSLSINQSSIARPSTLLLPPHRSHRFLYPRQTASFHPATRSPTPGIIIIIRVPQLSPARPALIASLFPSLSPLSLPLHPPAPPIVPGLQPIASAAPSGRLFPPLFCLAYGHATPSPPLTLLLSDLFFLPF